MSRTDIEEHYVICPRPGEIGAVLVREAEKTFCAECKTLVCMSASSKKARDERGMSIICLRCGLTRIKENKDAKFSILPEADEEFNALLKKMGFSD